MGISSRDYYREENPRGIGNWQPVTLVVKYLIWANVTVFLLQIFVVREAPRSPLETLRRMIPELDRYAREHEEDMDDAELLEKFKNEHPRYKKMWSEEDYVDLPAHKVPILQNWLELDTRKVVEKGQVWRLITHAFCHDRMSPWHILFNMLLLYWFGTTLESMYGHREFFLFYMTAILAAALTSVGLDLYTGNALPGIGASGGVLAVMMLYTMHFPYERIYVFWFWPVEMRWVMVLYTIFDLHPVLLALAGENLYTGIGHAAHLGGTAFGFLYYKFDWHLEGLFSRLPRSIRQRRRPRLRIAPETIPDDEPAVEHDQDQVDIILQKIFESGQASLTDDERALLQRASQRMKNKLKGGT